MRIKHFTSILVIGTSLGTVLHAQEKAIDLYAAPHGAGESCSSQDPCSLEKAQEKTRVAVAGQSAVSVHLAAGRYLRTKAWAFDSSDSGTRQHPVVWSGPASGEAVIDGGERIGKWKISDAHRNLWSASLQHDHFALQIYVNGVRAVRARREGCRKEDCSYLPEGLKGATAYSLRRLKHPEDVVAVFGVRWRDFHCRVNEVKGDRIVMAEPCWHNTVVDSEKNGWSNASPKGKPYAGVDWFENAFEFLDAPGQFYIDRRKQVIYYIPRAGEDMRVADVELPVAEQLLSVNGTPSAPVHDLAFEGITFAHAGWKYPEADGYVPLQAGYLVTGKRNDLPDNGEGMLRIPAAVHVAGGDHIVFRHDHFKELGAAGVAMDGGTRDSAVTASRFEEISGGGIFIGDTVAAPSSRESRSARNTVSHNVITRVAQEYRDNVGVMGGFNDGLMIDHNTITDLPYTGISVGWGWNYEGEGDVQKEIHIRSNRIERFMLTLHDGGAIYTQAQSPGSDVTENYISYKGGDNGNGIYLDERSRKYEVCGNVIWDVPAKMQEGQWLSTWASWSGFLEIHDNWSDDTHTALHSPGPTKRFFDNHLALKEMPTDAKAVMRASGVEGGNGLVTNCLQGKRQEKR